ncbi:MAG: hypothetical protein KAG61_03610 [Bacteriovoracaceae bacterium]|nr:hypothetical protein [Bacteriovoracaceae bacterium]
MSGNPKFAILERDGIEHFGQVEYVPESDDILYVAGKSKTMKEKIDEPKQIHRRFSSDVEVLTGMVMVLHDPEFNSNCILNGSMVLI